MLANLYQKILGNISSWFKITRLPAEPVLVPVTVRINAARQNRPMSIHELRVFQQRFRQ